MSERRRSGEPRSVQGCVKLTGAILLAAGAAACRTGDDDMKADFYVAPGGSDTNPGTVRKPFATLARARDAARAAKKDGLRKDIVVQIRGGTYRLTEPLAFGPEDSGAEKHSITYAAAPGEKPVLSGGRPITGWKKGRGHRWTVVIPEVKTGKWHFRQLFVNGRRATLARSPNDGFFRVVKAGPDKRTSFTFRPGDLKAFRNLGEVEILFLHDWCTSRVRVKEVDEATHTVTLADPIGCAGSDFYAITGFEATPRYAVENAEELLDAPGEWYLDRQTGTLNYWPLDGEALAIADVVAPVLNELLVVKGSSDETNRVANLRFVGLTFSHAEFPLPEHGYAEGQAGFYEERPNQDKSQGWGRIRNPAAVILENATGCALENCEVSGVGGSGISLQGRCETNRVVGCHVRDVGGNGIMVGETENKPELLARRNTVANNYVHHCAQIAHGCVGIWVGLTEGTVVAHNEICDLPYTGVSVGWRWDTNPTQCQKNVVEFNHIHRVMQMLSDGGGIYTLGRQPGTVLRGNRIHDIPVNAGRAESNGIFMDEGSSGMLVEGNLIQAVSQSPIRFHKAEKNTIRRNVLFVSAGRRPFTFNRCDEGDMAYENNRIETMPRIGAREGGRAGQAFSGDGIGAYEEAPHSPDLEPAQLTLTAWIKLAEEPSGEETRRWIANKNGNEWCDGHYALAIDGRNAGAYLNIGGGRENAFSVWSASSPLKLKRWHHLAATYDEKELRVYVDGTLAGSTAVNKARRPGTTPLAIGRRQDGFAASYFPGAIDDVRLYRKALSPDEVAQEWQTPDRPPAAASLVACWSFEEEAPRTPHDAAAGAGLDPAYRTTLLRR